jgi:transposase|tara:strand:- start:928 stop:1314 length:387 start_codon:yes stop_codon:yes gene_type:complete
MSKESPSAILEADSQTQETRSFIKKVRRITRRRYTPEEKIRIVLDGFRRELPVRDLCRREGIRPNVYYVWLKDFMEAGKERLTRDMVRDASRREVGDLKRENERLKQLVAELSLKVHLLKKTEVPSLD